MNILIPVLDHKSGDAAIERQKILTKPPGSLGVLEGLPIQFARIQGTSLPLSRPAAVFLFAADHPVTKHGISPYPSAVTRAMVENFVRGGACASILAENQKLPLHVIDVGVDNGASLLSDLCLSIFFRDGVADATEGDILVEDGLDEATFARARAAGRNAVERAGNDLKVAIFGEMGIGNTTIAAAVAAKLLRLSNPGDIVGRGTGADDRMVERKRDVVRRAVKRLDGEECPREILRRLGGRELAALYGAFEKAIENRTVILVDGFIVSAVALALVQEQPEALDYMVFSHHSAEQGHTSILDAMGASALLSLSLRLGEGSGALLAMPLVEQALALHRSMATFAEAAIPDKE